MFLLRSRKANIKLLASISPIILMNINMLEFHKAVRIEVTPKALSTIDERHARDYTL
jgi:hypothetical protein